MGLRFATELYANDVLYKEPVIFRRKLWEVDDLATCPGIHDSLSLGGENMPLPILVVKRENEHDSSLSVGLDEVVYGDSWIVFGTNMIRFIAEAFECGAPNFGVYSFESITVKPTFPK